jgi:hypothetical protein
VGTFARGRPHCGRVLRSTIIVSFAAHVAIAALVLAPPRTPPPPPADPPAATFAGDTFELPAPDVSENAVREEAVHRSASGEGEPPRPARPARAGRAAASASGAASTHASEGSSSLYGAIADRSAADLATAFTRGFPQAASADPVWRSAPLGSFGTATVVLTLSEVGTIEHVDVQGAPSAALANGIRRTLALLGSRPLTARGKTTRLVLTGMVSADQVHDGLHGEVFAIGGSFAGGEGHAFFALAIGRRIDLTVRAR